MTARQPQLSPEILVPRLGNYLVEKGLISTADLDRALAHQARLREKNDVRLIGQVLIDLNIVDRVTLDTAVTEQVLALGAALQEANAQLQEANQQLERRVQERTSELQRALEKLSELNQLKANIVANISHELRTPLTHLKGYIELLLGGDFGGLSDPQKGAVEIMSRSSERLSRLIEDLIMFSVSEREQLHLRIGRINIENMCGALANKTAQRMRERNLQLKLEIEKGLPEVEGDEEKVSWVIAQFLDNAIKFTPPSGTITIRAVRVEKLVNISVADTGIGIPEGRVDEIFDSFYQLDGSTTRRVGGTGLGLALAKKIVEAHGSIIQVTSDLGKGSCFSFTMKLFTEKSIVSALRSRAD
jgi:two-component system phosphate regulon sensor histidine kinase PhoR